MRLPQTAEYAVRGMAYMATLDNETAIRAKDLSEATSIPVYYLSKIMRRLVVSGLVESQKGHGGGFKLNRLPHEINFLDILSSVDYVAVADRCVFGWGACNTERPCPLHPVWSTLNEVFFEWAKTTTLADVGPWVPLSQHIQTPT